MKKLYEETAVQDIADAIREKTGGAETYKIAQMGAAVRGITTGGATEPYVEEIYDSSGNLTAAVLHGHLAVRPYAFDQCGFLASVTIPDSVTSIERSAFSSCFLLRSVTIPDSVTSIEGYAFSNCKGLASVTIPGGVTIIEDWAFYSCSGLTSVTIPGKVSKIGSWAFNDCSSLTSVTFDGTPRHIGQNAFYGCPKLTTINVPWAEGAVSGAPWGAKNATINYNYKGA